MNESEKKVSVSNSPHNAPSNPLLPRRAQTRRTRRRPDPPTRRSECVLTKSIVSVEAESATT